MRWIQILGSGYNHWALAGLLRNSVSPQANRTTPIFTAPCLMLAGERDLDARARASERYLVCRRLLLLREGAVGKLAKVRAPVGSLAILNDVQPPPLRSPAPTPCSSLTVQRRSGAHINLDDSVQAVLSILHDCPLGDYVLFSTHLIQTQDPRRRKSVRHHGREESTERGAFSLLTLVLFCHFFIDLVCVCV